MKPDLSRSAADPVTQVQHPVALDDHIGLLQEVLAVDRPEVPLAGAEHDGNHLTAVADVTLAGDGDALFEFGLDLLVRGLTAYKPSRPTRR
jgi:hypothetical protein